VRHPVDLTRLDPHRLAQFRKLTRTPGLSLYALTLWGLVVGSYIAVWSSGMSGALPLWQGALINSVVGYFAFSIVHDSIHHSISRRGWLNDLLGQSAVVVGAPYLALPLFRWAHIQHHRYANTPRDPDWVLHGPAWSLPLRWMFIDVLYLLYILRHRNTAVRRYVNISLLWVLASAAALGALWVTGHAEHLLMLWFIPSRMVFLTLGFAFFWLPHVPHDTAQEENFTRATTVRLGHEWLLSPLLQFQNFHLIHHLWPTTPFYNNHRVWQLLEPELRQHDLSIQHGFDLHPSRVMPARW